LGRDFGPDLSRIGSKYNRAELLGQIIEPGKVVEPQWQPATLSLHSGENVQGFIAASDNAAHTVKLPTGEARRIPNAQIANAARERVSPMPEGLLQNLTAAEAADLLRFLESLK
jgi:putative heme-binding domain-containing protein